MESGGPRGYYAVKKVKGRKRQALVDMDGRALVLDPQPADVQDRDGAVPVLRLSRRSFPFIVKAFADAGYAGDKPASATIMAVEMRAQAARIRLASLFTHVGGSSNGSSPGSAAIGASGRIRKRTRLRQEFSSTPQLL